MATCSANAGCSIDCPGGCYAIYTEPDGPCHTGCSGSLAEIAGGDATFAIEINGLSPADIGVLLGAAAPAGFLDGLEADAPISFKGTGLTKASLAEQLAQRTG